MIEKSCAICGAPVPEGKRNYCSKSCYTIAQSHKQKTQGKRPKNHCIACGVEIPASNKYCDAPKCRAIQRENAHKRTFGEYNCEHCGARFTRSAPNTRFCSKECAYEGRDSAKKHQNERKKINPYFLRRGDTRTMRVGSSFTHGVAS